MTVLVAPGSQGGIPAQGAGRSFVFGAQHSREAWAEPHLESSMACGTPGQRDPRLIATWDA